MEAKRIDWKLFESPYWSPERGVLYPVVLANWRMEFRSYDDEKTEKPVIVFDVLRIDAEEYPLGRKVFVTGASSFAEQMKPILFSAEEKGKNTVEVYLEYGKDKQYRVMDMNAARRFATPNPHG